LRPLTSGNDGRSSGTDILGWDLVRVRSMLVQTGMPN
jgi:hypothetical protein